MEEVLVAGPLTQPDPVMLVLDYCSDWLQYQRAGTTQ